MKKASILFFRIWLSLMLLMIAYVCISAEMAPRHLSRLSMDLVPLVKILSLGAERPWNRFIGYLPQLTLDVVSSMSTFLSILSIPIIISSSFILIRKFGAKGFFSLDVYTRISSGNYRSRFGGRPIGKNWIIRFLAHAIMLVFGVRFFIYTYASHEYFIINNVRDLLLASVGSAICLALIAAGAYGSILTLKFRQIERPNNG